MRASLMSGERALATATPPSAGTSSVSSCSRRRKQGGGYEREWCWAMEKRSARAFVTETVGVGPCTHWW